MSRLRRATPKQQRRLTLEALEPRAVPAGLVQEFPLPPEFVSSPYSTTAVGPDEVLDSNATSVVQAENVTAPATEADSLIQRLPLNHNEHLGAAALRPDGGLRLAGSELGAFAAVWDFDATGNLIRDQRLGLLPGRTHAAVEAMSPSGRWILGQQYDTTYDANNPGPAFVIWDGDHPDEFTQIDTSQVDPFGAVKLVGITDARVVILQAPGIISYRWDAEHGFQRLPSLREAAGDTSEEAKHASAAAISADGSVVVGYSDDQTTRRPTVWTTTGPRALPTLGQMGGAASVSSDGRVVGGWTQAGSTFRAAVRVDDELVELNDEQGQPLSGMATTVVNGLAGDPHQWVAFGSVNQQGWIAFSDGVAHPLDSWLYAHYGLDLYARDGSIGVNTLGRSVLDAFVRDNVLYLAAHEWMVGSITASIPPSVSYIPVNPYLIVAPLGETGGPPDLALDVDHDGIITPTDALLIVNVLNEQAQTGAPSSALDRLDVDGDGVVTPSDALAIINHLNNPLPSPTPSQFIVVGTPPDGEGEATPSPSSHDPALLAFIADDLCRELDSLHPCRTTRR